METFMKRPSCAPASARLIRTRSRFVHRPRRRPRQSVPAMSSVRYERFSDKCPKGRELGRPAARCRDLVTDRSAHAPCT